MWRGKVYLLCAAYAKAMRGKKNRLCAREHLLLNARLCADTFEESPKGHFGDFAANRKIAHFPLFFTAFFFNVSPSLDTKSGDFLKDFIDCLQKLFPQYRNYPSVQKLLPQYRNYSLSTQIIPSVQNYYLCTEVIILY